MKTNEEKKNVSDVIWYKNKKNWFQICGIICASFVSLFGIDSILVHYNIYILEYSNSFLTFILLSFIVALIRIIFIISKFYNEKPEVMGVVNNDSLSGMIMEAYNDKRYAEVVKIGTALSEALWYSGRHSLRLEISSYVKDAAEKIDDYYTYSRMLIEDLGNGTLEMRKKVVEAIKFIESGLSVAIDNNYWYLAARGYRNLACAYAYKYHKSNKSSCEDLSTALKYYELGCKVCESIEDEKENLDALGSLKYALCKIKQLENDSKGAIESLKGAIDHYDNLSKKPGSELLSRDRLVKIYREIGRLYLGTQNNVKIGIDYLKKSIKMAEDQRDYSNALRAGIELISYYSEIGDNLSVKPIITQCDNFFEKAENIDMKKKYKEIMMNQNN